MTNLPRGTGSDGGLRERPAVEVFAPYESIRYAYLSVYGGVRGLLAWLDYCEREIERDERHCIARIAWCEAQNQHIAEHGAPAMVPGPPRYNRTGVSP